MFNRFTFNKQEKLKSRKQIDLLFKSGKTVYAHPCKLWFETSGKKDDFRKSAILTGVTASSKNFKHAVDRNRIKRMLREAFRLNALLLKAHCNTNKVYLNLFFVYTAKTVLTYSEIEKGVTNCLQKLQQHLETA